jgi:hypothetical protein
MGIGLNQALLCAVASGQQAHGILSFDLLEYDVAGSTATLVVTRTGGSAGAVSVQYTTVQDGTAVAGVDYTTTSGTLNWPAGDAAVKLIQVPISVASGWPKTLSVEIASPTGGATLGAITDALVRINEEWTPAALGSTLKLWFNDDSAVTDAGGGACSQWNDISGNAYHVTQSTSGERPLIVAGALNGRRVVRFDGGNDNFNLPSGALGVLNNVARAWSLTVHKEVSPGNANEHILGLSGGASSALRYAAKATGGGLSAGGRRLDSDSFFQVEHGGALQDQWAVAVSELRYERRELEINAYGDAGNVTSNAWTGAGNTSATNSLRARVGADTSVSPANFFRGDTAEILLGTGNLARGDRSRLAGYAAHRWGLQANLGSATTYRHNKPWKDPHYGSTRSLLHMDPAGGSNTVFRDERGKVWTPHGNAIISTAQSVHGGACAYFDGAGSYLSTPDHADWSVGSNDFTFEFFFFLAADTGNNQPFIFQRDITGGEHDISFYAYYNRAAGQVNFALSSDGTAANKSEINTGAGSVGFGQWYHFAAARKDGIVRTFLGGGFKNSLSFPTTFNSPEAVLLGRNGAAGTFYLHGYIDELRVANGVCRYTEDFMVPIAPFPNA